MCGYAFLQSEVNEYHERFASATKSLHHRGPDNQELFTTEDQSFFHARLSIIDVHERSNQPFRKHGLTLLYNGEIYNFRELKKALVQTYGASFDTKGDTEVLLEGFFYEGTEFFSRLKGMFSVVITNSESIILARDEFGQKPLFFSVVDKSLMVASEQKSILITWNHPPTANKNAIESYLKFGAPIAPQTFHTNVEQLSAGMVMTINRTDLSSRRTSQIKGAKSASGISLSDQLKAVVSLTAVADVRTAVLSSGGVDSTLISMFFPQEKLNTANFYHFSSGYDAQGLKTAQKSAEDRGCTIKIVERPREQGQSLEEVAEILLERFQEPFADTSYIFSQNLYVAIDQNTKVLIGGDGADEMFGGYNISRLVGAMCLFVKILPIGLRRLLVGEAVFSSRFGKFFQCLLGSRLAFQKIVYGVSSADLRFLSRGELERGTVDLFENDIQVIKDYEHFIFTRLTNVFLKKSDHASMFASKELRSPMLHLRRQAIKPTFLLCFPSKWRLKQIYASHFGVWTALRRKVGFDMKIANEFPDLRVQTVEKLKETDVSSLGIEKQHLLSLIENSNITICWRVYLLLRWVERVGLSANSRVSSF